jgi:signal transduction histidine kinase
MTIVKYLVDAHHGRIEIDSAPGSGTTVKIFLPVRQADVQPPAATP